jgi:hypothetical protein
MKRAKPGNQTDAMTLTKPLHAGNEGTRRREGRKTASQAGAASSSPQLPQAVMGQSPQVKRLVAYSRTNL